jgi:hypothetical protein
MIDSEAPREERSRGAGAAMEASNSARHLRMSDGVLEAEGMKACAESEYAKEAAAAFPQGREPAFKGR